MNRDLIEMIKSNFSYDSMSGLVTNNRPNVRSKNGWIVTTRNGIQYIQFSLLNKKIYGHVIAWILSHGQLEFECIDHINGIGTDNRLLNLRNISRSLNQRNRRMGVNNTSGYTGVYFDKRIKKMVR